MRQLSSFRIFNPRPTLFVDIFHFSKIGLLSFKGKIAGVPILDFMGSWAALLFKMVVVARVDRWPWQAVSTALQSPIGKIGQNVFQADENGERGIYRILLAKSLFFHHR